MSVLRLSRAEARRIAVRAQLLAAPRPVELLDVVRHLASVQVDLTAAVAPSPELVCWSRLGAAYRLGDLDDLFDAREVVELRGRIMPAEDIRFYRAELEDWGRHPRVEWQEMSADWVDSNDLCRREILDRLATEAPLPAAAFDDTCQVPWRSSGWTNNQNVVRLIDFMESRGEVAVAARGERGERLWDLADRVYPETDTVPLDDAIAQRAQRSLRALGLMRSRVYDLAGILRKDIELPGEPAVIDGVRGQWRVDPDQLDRSFRGRAALLSPLDRLVFDRKRMEDIFDFDYQLEMYKPKAKRRWGYWALPILYGDRLVGKVDATADRETGRLVVHAIHEDVDFSATMRSAVRREINALATLLGLRRPAGDR
ncbi:DNA glycosylase AlkZ-like family protein [Flexivirga sp. B27]